MNSQLKRLSSEVTRVRAEATKCCNSMERNTELSLDEVNEELNMMKIAGETLSGRMDRVSMTIQNRMEELDDQLQNVVSRQQDVRRREHARKAGPLLLSMNSKVHGSHDEPTAGSAASASPNYAQTSARAPAPQEDVQADVRSAEKDER